MIDDSDFIFAQSLREKKCFCWCHTNTLGTILRRFPQQVMLYLFFMNEKKKAVKTANAHIELADNADPALPSVSLTWQTWLRLWWFENLDKRGFGDPKKFIVFIVALVTPKAFMSGPKTWQLWLQHSVTWKQSKCGFGDLKSEDKFQLDLFTEWIYPGIGLAFLFVTCVAVIHTFLLSSNVTKGANEATISVENRS